MGYIKIIIAILLWSSLGIFVRRIGLPNAAIIFYSTAIASLLQLPILLFKGRVKEALESASRTNKMLLVTGVPFFSLVNVLLFYFAFTHTTIANAVLSHYTAPIFVALMAPIFLKEKNHKATWLAIILSSIGLWLMLWMPSSGVAVIRGVSERQGIIAGAVSGLAYALLILTVRTLAPHFSSVFIIFVQNSIIAVVLFPFVLDLPFQLHALPYLLFMGVVHSTIAPIIYVQGFKSVRANDAAILGYFEPVGAIILALIFLKEVPDIKALLGGLLILYSGFIIIKRRNNNSSQNKLNKRV